MRLHVVAVGRLKAGPHADLVRHYAERLTWPLSIREVEERRKLSPAELKEREGAHLLSAVPPGAMGGEGLPRREKESRAFLGIISLLLPARAITIKRLS